MECLWRSVKYEEVYLNDYHEVREAKNRLGQYFQFYNSERLHQSLGYHVPAEVYYGHQLALEKAKMEYLGIPKAGLILPGSKSNKPIHDFVSGSAGSFLENGR